MNINRRGLIVSACALVLVAAVWIGGGEYEPRYNGRSLSEWLEIASTNRPEGMRALRQIGTNGLPYALKWISNEPPAWRDKLYWSFYKVPTFIRPYWFMRFISNERANRRANLAPLIIRATGADAVEIAQDLKRLTYRNSGGVAYNALDAFYFMGTNGFPQLLEILNDPENPYRGRAATIVGDIVEEHPSIGGLATPPLVKCLADTNDIVVMRASEAVVTRGVDVPSIIPFLVTNLGSTNSFIRGAATNALKILAPQLLGNVAPR